MTTAPRTYACVRRTLDHPIEVVWTYVAAFGGIEKWVTGVEACRVEGEGVGAIRTVRLGEREAREQLEVIDAAGRRLRYRILPPHALPAEDVCSEISLTALDDGRTEMVWRSEASSFTGSPEQLGERIERFYGLSIDGLARLLREG